MKATTRFEVRRMKAAETSADLDEAEWEEANFYQTEIGWGCFSWTCFCHW